MELELLKRGILRPGPDDNSPTLPRSISYSDWLELQHIMGEWLGFKSNWLLDNAALKAGLLAAIEQLTSPVISRPATTASN
jgi:hypothetical protein